MVKRNKNFAKLQAGYLFPEINRRKKEFMEKHPDADLISLGIGDTTEPLPQVVVEALKEVADEMGTVEGYSGYGDEQGLTELRKKVAEIFYPGLIEADELFISDGAKCDTGRLQMMFGNEMTIAVQDPSYPVYVDSAVIMGQTGSYVTEKKQFENIVYMPCTAENDFFPKLKKADIIYFCSPNNPTGAVATKEQLEHLVRFAKENDAIIVFDAAYAEFITDPNLPKTIYEIEGAKEVAIEVSSFSKPFGYTGVRLGWTVVPKELKYSDGTAVHNDWNRIMTTVFNGASNIIQKATLRSLNDEGLGEMKRLIAYYLQNAKIIKDALDKMGYQTYGGDNAPYIWVKTKSDNSWKAFNHILEETQIVTTPGSGFGPGGETYVRFSAFGHRKKIEEAVARLQKAVLEHI
ncbi:LL-diaminopimelate aminotransferase [Candidatus Woesearchaeota archaeon]|nr:LL-diaminopimelate aminotransferase [Candidatus Woesearchaeota archaeon]